VRFAYGQLTGAGQVLDGAPFVVVDLETTGLSAQEDRIVEIAMARVENGVVVDEWATLIDSGRDPGPTFLHHISQQMLIGAPTFRDVAGDILARLDGAVVVAHHAPFEEGFLAAAFARIGIETAPLPTVDTLRICRAVLASPNYKLATCCEILGVGLTDAHTALGDVRATAQLLPRLLAVAPTLRFPVALPALPTLPRQAVARTRVTNLRKGEDGWIRSLLTKLPVSMHAHDPVGAEPYLDYLADAVAEGRLTGAQTRVLGRLAGRAGMGAAQVHELHRRFLDGLRDSALRDGELTKARQQQLTAIARVLDEPSCFADITPDVEPVALRQPGPSVWCSPAVPQQSRQRLSDAGYQLATNVTRTVVAAVVAPGDEALPRARRATELGATVVGLSDIASLLASDEVPAQRDHLPAPVAPAGWYPDPTGRSAYRFWNGAAWTDRVSAGGAVIAHDRLR
jgi:DNA polymerase III subunit epsilon